MKFSKKLWRIFSRIVTGHWEGASRCVALPGAREARPPLGRGHESLDGSQHRGVDSSRPGRSSASSLLGWSFMRRSSRSQSIIRWTLSRLVSPSSAFPFPPLSGCFHFGVLGPTFKSLSMPDSSPKLNTTTSISSSKTSRSVWKNNLE